MSRSIWSHKKGDFLWDLRNPHIEVFSDITRNNVKKSVRGLNPDEYKEMNRVGMGMSTVVTKYAPLLQSQEFVTEQWSQRQSSTQSSILVPLPHMSSRMVR